MTRLGLTTPQGRLDSSQLEELALEWQTQVPRGSRIAITGGSTRDVLSALMGLEDWAAEVLLVPSGTEVPDVRAYDAQVQQWRGAEPDEQDLSHPTRWTLFTSGTTGVPKRVRHTRLSLTRTLSSGTQGAGRAHYVWAMVYDANRMAGLQVLMRALLADEQLVEADRGSGLQERVRFFMDSGVTAISATPTLWRQILLCDGVDEWPLTQITLGGEMADQRILDALATRYPSARITHIFAATETGVAFAVSDRLAGFPEEYLNSAPHGVRMRVREGGLEVHNPLVVDAPADGFIRTGDVVEVRDGRIHFLGRDSGAVNVGGVLVWPEQIEVSLREHPDVLDALVTSTSSSFAGNLLMAQVVLAEGSAVTGSDLRAWVRDRWPASHVPARVRVVEQLPVSAAGKAQR